MAQQQLVTERQELALLTAEPPLEQVQLHEAEITKANVRLERLEYELSQSTVFAPATGVIVREDLNLGQIARSMVMAGQLMMSIEATDSFVAKVSVRERDLPYIALDQDARLKVYGYPDREFEARVTKISPTVQESDFEGLMTSAVTVTLEIDNADGVLRSGMTGEARILSQETNYFDMLSRQIVHWFRIQFWW
jgi:multidrug resistance efflux pump